MQTQINKRAVLVFGSHDALNVGSLASALEGVEGVTADPGRGQVRVRYDPDTVQAQHIRRALAPVHDDAELPVRLLAAWPKLAQVLPIVAAVSLL
jgi:hypothetical protein